MNDKKTKVAVEMINVQENTTTNKGKKTNKFNVQRLLWQFQTVMSYTGKTVKH